MIKNGHQSAGQSPATDAFAEGIKAKVARGELSGPEGQRLLAERWGVDLAHVQGHPRGLTLFDATATQAYDDYLAHTIPPAELKQHLRGHEFFVPFPASMGA